MKFSKLLGGSLAKSVLAAGVFMLMSGTMAAAAETVIYMPHNLPGESTWTFDHQMTPSETEANTWTTTLALHNCGEGTDADDTAWFTFYDKAVTGWNNDAHRFGGLSNGLVTVPEVEYTATINNQNCFVINEDGTYEITFKLAEDGQSATITFNRTGDYNEEDDPIINPPTPPVPPVTNKSYCYFQNSANWSSVYVWAWNGSTNYTGGDWPGKKLEPNDEGFYYWETTEGTPANIIFSNGSGTQTDNLSFNNGYYYKADGTSSAEKPEIVDPPFNPDDPDDPSSNFDDGVFTPKNTDVKYSQYFPAANDKEYVFFVKPDNWTAKVYAWNDQNEEAAGAWSGEPMEQYKGNVYIWVNRSNFTPTKLIINNNGGDKAGGGDLDFYNHATYYQDGSHKGGTIILPPQPSDNAGPVSTWKLDNGVVEFTCEKATLFITPYTDKVVKVFTLPTGSTAQERASITVVAEPDPSLDIEVDERSDDYVINVNGTALQIVVDKQTGLLSFSETTSNGPTQKLSENHYLDNAASTHTVNFLPQEDAAFYGGGPSSSKGSIKDQTIVLDNKQKWGWNSYYNDSHNIEIPFVVSTSNYGVLFDDHYRGAKMMPSSAGLSYESNSVTPISYYFIGGEDMDEVVANYTGLTGRQPLPPFWSLGYITSRYGYYSFDEGDQVISDIKAKQLPLDGIVYDLYWQGNREYYLGTLDWGANFPNPQQKLSDWKQNKGIHTILITEPYFTDICSNWDDLKNRGYLADEHVSDNDNMSWLLPDQDVRYHNVGLIDATNPDAMDWMYNFYKARTQEGVDGWWLDLGEPEGYDDDNNTHHKGGTNKQVRNEFGQIWVGHIHDCLTRDFPEMRQFIMPRAGTSGMQRYSAFPWTGDIERSWSGFQAQVPSLTNMAMAGFSMLGSDVGGFACTSGSTNANLYLRWVQFGALSPMLRTHSAVRPEPYHSDYNSVIDGVRKAINLRYRLLPYVYTLAYENSAFGYPMARPACAFDQNKYTLANNSDSYLWGRDLFVAPILSENATSRQITFPEGEWADMNDVLKAGVNTTVKPKTYQGDMEEHYYYAGDNIPFFMRKGSFIPMFTQTNDGATSEADMQFHNTSELNYGDLTVYHYLSEDDHTSIMYEDDLKSRSALENNKYRITKFSSHFVAGSNDGQLYNISISQEGDASVSVQTRTIHFYCFGYENSDIHGLLVHLPQSEPANAPHRANLHAPGISTLADEDEEEDDVLERFHQAVKGSLQEAQNAEGHAIYHDKDNNMLYVKAANVPTTGNILMEMGSIPTAITDVLVSNVSLSYVAGKLNYSIGSNAKDAVIEVYSADGRLLSTITPTVFNGHVNSVDAPEADGFCIARLTAKDAYGNVKTANCKYFVK